MELTVANLQNAKTYIPLGEKEDWVARNAPKCFDRLSVMDGDRPLPDMYQINTGIKSRFLMAALVWKYLGYHLEGQEDSGDPDLMSEKEYDIWGAYHIMNELERWKSDREVRSICFDILADYHDLEKRFSAAINALLTVQNDPVVRKAQYDSEEFKKLPEIVEQMKKLQEGRGEK